MFTPPLYGDERDGELPPITLENFPIEAFRYGAMALRARLSRLPRAELDVELNAAVAFLAKFLTLEEIERMVRENDERELSKRQAERAKGSRLQPAILAAAHHYRAQAKSAGEAWDAIELEPFSAGNGELVVIERKTKGKTRDRLKEVMCVRLRDGRQPKGSIKFVQWRQSYWPKAAKRVG
jgi:hypothetical protein